MHRFSRRVIAAVIVVPALAFASIPASAQVSGPTYPAPGGNSFSAHGDAGVSSGQEATYANFNPSQFGSLYWTLTSIANPYSTSQGAHGDMMFFGFSGNLAIFRASSVLAVPTMNGTFTSTVFLNVLVKPVNSPDGPAVGLPWTSAGAAGISPSDLPSSWPVFNATAAAAAGGFDVWTEYTADSYGTGATPLNDWYDGLAGKSVGEGLHTSAQGNFFYTAPVNVTVAATPEPATVALLATGFVGLAGFGAARKRRERVGPAANS